MRYYIDCEFDGHNGPLLSFAIVREDDPWTKSLHVTVRALAYDDWVLHNVVSVMDEHESATDVSNVHPNHVGGFLRRFISDDDSPVIIADSPVDIGRFCQALMTNDSGDYCPNDIDLIEFEVHDISAYPTDLPRAVQHNAWWDAMALREKLIPSD